mmetsp:Transcript_35404/g.40356  ORF Transcript_35404/g.40356 Transcript_35404/m.40356 type:complete len:101 (+) Transcript_35404:115-417(+)|eukprot:CAMPEP_0194130206 /NCGR_PEP_ID=MMETSP0152-20130528/1298_1 /TAXON_ID=1049557 /ORGANISM="Thalassiothrix antarctica, Strain L6-D1" /LENGTH=100 /DNA_ID=CAMNT_0038824639 /DNA_START=103 /DNA_END=405 /DNA_ORIENTATION=-
MSRGDQRERDRAKSQAKLAQKQNVSQKAGDLHSRNQNDKDALLNKIAAKKAMQGKLEKQAAEDASIVKKPMRKKKQVKEDSLDDIFNEALKKGKNKKRQE